MKKSSTIYPATLHNKYGRVHIYKMANGRGGDFYCVAWSVGKARQRKSFQDEVAANNHAESLLEQFKNGTPMAGGFSLNDAAYFEECRKLLGGVPLRTAIEYYLSTHGGGDKSHSTPISEVRDAFLRDLGSLGNSEADILTCTSHLSQFCDSVKLPIAAIQPTDIDSYLREKTCSNRTKKNTRTTLVRLWNWAKSKGFLPKHLDTAATEASRYKEERTKSPGIFSPEHLAEMLDVVSDRWLPYFSICAFAGLRQAECRRLKWSDINLSEKVIVLGADITKTNKRRIAHMPDNLVKWLQCDEVKKLSSAGGPVCPVGTPNIETRKISKAVKIPWVNNGLRHSYISYQMALVRDAAKVAEQCGNSQAMLQANYKANALESEAKKWFSIEPA